MENALENKLNRTFYLVRVGYMGLMLLFFFGGKMGGYAFFFSFLFFFGDKRWGYAIDGLTWEYWLSPVSGGGVMIFE